MDADTLAALAGIFMANAVVVWRSEGARREMRKHKEPAAHDVERLARVETRVDGVEGRVSEHSAQIQHMVTDDEFATYTNTTTATIRELTAEVSRATGQLEATWKR